MKRITFLAILAAILLIPSVLQAQEQEQAEPDRLIYWSTSGNASIKKQIQKGMLESVI